MSVYLLIGGLINWELGIGYYGTFVNSLSVTGSLLLSVVIGKCSLV